MLIGFRFLSGIAVASTTLNAGTVVDMFPQSQRGTAMSIMGFSPLVGVVCGSILGGYVTANLSWRWAFWLVAIVAGSLEVGFLLFFRETYSFTILERKAKRLRRETGNANLRSKFDQGKSAKELFKRAIMRPAKMLIFSPIVMMLSLYNSLVYGYLYLVITILPSVFQDVYHFKQGPVGLMYLGIGIGMTLAVILCRLTLDRLIKRQAAKVAQNHDTNHHETDQAVLIDPEHRLPPMLLGGTLLPLGLFLYGWTSQYHLHWIAPIIGTALLGFGLMVTLIPTSTYLMDVYTIYAASAAAANLCLKNLFGTVLPLAGPPLYKKLGLGWGNSLLGFLALSFVPIPLILMKFGKRLRSSENQRLVL